MAFCPNCGSNVEGRFCAKCGTSVAPPAGAAPSGGAGAGAGYAQAPGQAPAAGPSYSAPPPPYNPPPPGYGQQPSGQPGYGAAPPPPPGYGAGPGAPPPPGYGAPGAYVPPPPGAASTGLADNIAGALCYTPFVGWIIAIVFLVMEPYNRNRNVRFHAFQGLFFAIGIFIINIILSTLMFSAFFGVGMWATFTMVFWLIRLVFLAAFLFLMWKAYNNERFVIPVIGPLSEQQANK